MSEVELVETEDKWMVVRCPICRQVTYLHATVLDTVICPCCTKRFQLFTEHVVEKDCR